MRLNGRAPIFIIGCGRSGTTLLGELLAGHPEFSYRYEPYHLWAAVDPITDFLHLYSRGEYHCLLDASSVTPTARLRFRRLISAPSGLTLVEKSPHNALRIGYLDALVPGARFIHIVRDGIDAARSIEKVARVNRRMAFRPSLNEWWGVWRCEVGCSKAGRTGRRLLPRGSTAAHNGCPTRRVRVAAVSS